MRSEFRRWLLLLVTLVGCSGSAPPFDELPLRDTLRADPEIVAALPDDARARLAARFQAAAAGDTAADPSEPAASVAAVVAQVDVARQRRTADALVIGTVGGGAAQALPSGSQTRGEAPLPAVGGLPATTTAELEAGALAGAAGATLRELLAASHASRLERVVGWPAAAVVVGDTAYVNGAWLVAMAAPGSDAGRTDAGSCDAGGCDGGASTGRGGSTMTTGGGEAVGGAGGRWGGLGGAGGRWGATGGTVWTPPSTWTPPPPPPDSSIYDNSTTSDNVGVTVDSCDSSTDDGSADSCDSSTDDGSGDSCNSNTDDGSQDSCSAPADDGTASGCQTAPGRRRPTSATWLWLMAPVAYLWGRKR